jgi:hypothetical protein
VKEMWAFIVESYTPAPKTGINSHKVYYHSDVSCIPELKTLRTRIVS